MEETDNADLWNKLSEVEGSTDRVASLVEELNDGRVTEEFLAYIAAYIVTSLSTILNPKLAGINTYDNLKTEAESLVSEFYKKKE